MEGRRRKNRRLLGVETSVMVYRRESGEGGAAKEEEREGGRRNLSYSIIFLIDQKRFDILSLISRGRLLKRDVLRRYRTEGKVLIETRVKA